MIQTQLRPLTRLSTQAAADMQFQWTPACPDKLPHYFVQLDSHASYFWRCRHCGELRCLPVTWAETLLCCEWQKKVQMNLLPGQFAMVMLICNDGVRLRQYAKLTEQPVDENMKAYCNPRYANQVLANAARLLGYKGKVKLVSAISLSSMISYAIGKTYDE